MKKSLLFIVLMLLAFSATAQTEHLVELKQNLINHVSFLASDSLMGRLIGSEGNLAAGEYIADKFEEIGLKSYTEQGYFDYFKRGLNPIQKTPLAIVEGCNIVGLLPGNDPKLKEEYIVIGAHYDHLGGQIDSLGHSDMIYNGADDNASGVATLIELARILKQQEKSLARTIVFVAFDGEEEGLWGSSHFVMDHVVPIEKVMLMISMDMVGYYGESNFLKLVGVGTIEQGKNIIPKSNILNVKMVPFEMSVMGATDTRPFAQAQVPTLYVTTGLKSPYHKPADEADVLTYASMADVTEYMSSVTSVLGNYGDLTSSGKFSETHYTPEYQFSWGPSAGIGTNTTRFTEGVLNGKPGFYSYVGVTGKMTWRRFLEVYGSLRFEQIGVKSAITVQEKVSMQSIAVPIGVKMYIPPMVQSPVGAFVSIYGYYKYNVSGKSRTLSAPLDFDGLWRKNEGGVGFSLGVRAAAIQVAFDARYSLSGLLVPQPQRGYNLQNNTYCLSLNYFF